LPTTCFRIEDDEVEKESALLAKFKPHRRAIYSIAVSKDKKKVFSASIDKTIKIWDLETGSLIKTLKGHNAEINCIILIDEKNQLISGSEDGTIKIWNLETYEVENEIENEDEEPIFDIAITPNKKYIVFTSEDKKIRIWDILRNRHVRTLEGEDINVNSVCTSNDGKTIASSAEKSIKIWKWGRTDFDASLEGHTFTISDLEFCPSDKNPNLLASCSLDKTIRIWDVEQGKEIKKYEKHTGGVNAIAFSDDGIYLASAAGDNSVYLFDLETDNTYGPFKHNTFVRDIKFIPGTYALISADYHGFVKVWDPFNEFMNIEKLINPEKVKGITPKCVEEEGIVVFISYATANSQKYKIPETAHLLQENYPDISQVLFWEESMKDDIFAYMNDNLGKADVVCVFCSPEATKSDAVRTEWMSALKLKKRIIPIFENESDIPPLLTTKLGIQYKRIPIKKFVEELHALIIKKVESKDVV